MGIFQRLLMMPAWLFIMDGLHAQSAINIKMGLLDRKFDDETSLIHYGQSYGLDAIIEDSRILFMPGLHYQQYSIVGSESRGGFFTHRDNIHQISLPVSLGTWLFADRWIKLRVYGGGHVNFIVGVDSNPAGINLDRVTTVHPGWQAGGQLMLWRFTADVRYYRDYRKVINVREESLLKGWEFLIGIAL